MSEEATATFTPPDRGEGNGLTLAGAALAFAAVPFLIGGLLVIEADTPPSGAPLLGMLNHALWALSTAILAVGVVALLRWVPALRRGLAGYLSTGVLGLAVLHGVNWVTWAYVDVRGAGEADRGDPILEGIVVPFGAGHLLAYAILLGTGIALLGWALRRTELVGRYVAWTGVGLGALTAVLAVGPLLAAVGGGSEGHVVFDLASLLVPVLYLWAAVVGIGLYRS